MRQHEWEILSFEEKVECCVNAFRTMLVSCGNCSGVHIEFDWSANKDKPVFSKEVTTQDIEVM